MTLIEDCDNWYPELFNPPIDFSYFVSISAAYHLFDEMESHYDPTQSCVLQVTITNLKSSVTEKVLVYLFDVYGVNELCMLQHPTHLEVFMEFHSRYAAS